MGADADPRALTINVKNVNGGPLGDVRAVDPRAPTINAKKHRRRAPWEAVPKIRESSPSTLRNVDDGPPLGRSQSWISRSVHHQRYETTTMGPLGGVRAGDLGAPIINTKKHQRRAPRLLWGDLVSIQDPKGVTCIGMIGKK
jgi:hypothetical protein